MTEKRVSTRYARALYYIANQLDKTTELFDDLQRVSDMIKSSVDLKYLLKSPVVQFWKKKKIFEEIFTPLVSELALKFFLLLADKHRENLIPDINVQYIEIYNRIHGRIPVNITSAVDIDDSTKKSIISKLTEYTKQEVLPNYLIDKNIKGGIKIKIDDWVFDASIKNQLAQLHKKLASGESI